MASQFATADANDSMAKTWWVRQFRVIRVAHESSIRPYSNVKARRNNTDSLVQVGSIAYKYVCLQLTKLYR